MSMESDRPKPQFPLPYDQIPKKGTPEHDAYVAGRLQSLRDDPVAMQKIHEFNVEVRRRRDHRVEEYMERGLGGWQSDRDSSTVDFLWEPKLKNEPPYVYEGDPLTPDELLLITPPQDSDNLSSEARREKLISAGILLLFRNMSFEDFGPHSEDDQRRKDAGESLGRPTIHEFLKSEWARIAREQNADGNHLMQDVSLDTPKGDE